MMPDYPELVLKPGRHTSLRHGHPWLFSGAVAVAPQGVGAGSVVRAVSSDRRPVALGFFNPRTDVAFRLLTVDTHIPVDADFWRRRFRSALALRARVVPPRTTAYRLINAEGDLMPGLVIDRYDDYLVVSIETQGMEQQRETLLDIVRGEVQPRGIYERSDGSARRREGLHARVGAVWGTPPPPTLDIAEKA
jgi:23S rRNA (cytosine1962-C5)-methyltransferase